MGKILLPTKNVIKHRNRKTLESIFCFIQFLFYAVSALLLYAVLLSIGSRLFVSVSILLLFLTSLLFDVFIMKVKEKTIARYEDIYIFAKLSIKKSDADIIRIFCNRTCDCLILYLAMDDAGRKMKLNRIFLIKKMEKSKKNKNKC